MTRSGLASFRLLAAMAITSSAYLSMDRPARALGDMVSTPPADCASKFIGRWTYSYGYTDVFSDGTAKPNASAAQRWTCSGNQYFIFAPSGARPIATLSPDGSTLSGAGVPTAYRKLVNAPTEQLAVIDRVTEGRKRGNTGQYDADLVSPPQAKPAPPRHRTPSEAPPAPRSPPQAGTATEACSASILHDSFATYRAQTNCRKVMLVVVVESKTIDRVCERHAIYLSPGERETVYSHHATKPKIILQCERSDACRPDRLQAQYGGRC